MSKKTYVLLSLLFFIILLPVYSIKSENNTSELKPNTENNFYDPYKYPEFYRGIYLNIYSARNLERLSVFADKAKKNKINTLVLDVQRGNSSECAVSADIVSYCVNNGLHPVARIVVFQDGLSKYPVPVEILNNRLNIALEACKNGFKEIQFDYIRFHDYRVSKHLTLEEKYAFLERFLQNARNYLNEYNIKIAVDVFGRIPLNNDDAIGQKMEVFDRVADIICPMAYPSHYTWSENLMSNPYQTVLITSRSAKERTKNAEIVTYIQAFQMKVYKSNMTFDKYIEEQLRAVHDSGVKGYILWNASQNYDVAFKVLGKYYKITQEAIHPVGKDKSS